MTTTVIRNAAWAIVWDAAQARHVYARDVDLAFADDRIVHVGPGYHGEADAVVDGRGVMVMPGLVDIHSHPQHEPSYRGIREEHGLRNQYMTGLYERSQAYGPVDDAAIEASFEAAACELLLSGTTTLCDIGAIFPRWRELFLKSGLRGFLAPRFATSRWKIENDHSLGFDWDEARGKAQFAEALAYLDDLAKDDTGMLTGVVSPMQIENCSGELLRDSWAAAQERGLPYTLHVAQGVLEVQEMIRRHGLTPVQWAHSLGILAPGTVLGHAIFLDQHSWINWWTKTDLGLLADTGTAVAHCPTPFARYGHIMENFGDYVRAGVTMGIGTDCAPHNMIEEIRKASTFARIAGRDVEATSVDMLFHAATVGGAKALMRDDIGRLAPGMKADVVLVDLSNPWMQPARDPLRSLVFHAADRAVRDVYIDGRQVVGDGKVLTLDHADACARLTEAQARMMEKVPGRDYLGRTADEITPMSLPMT
ncbi:amidohydrolase family protein [Albimonas sp. CAU 1670]|uniref:amidohydrolase family protein n=1 Tax=Albimonas sp. CAU 1670 TaxID=3032599 RepID=UPI0023DCDD09|nr:amidohydrolase family protein [Albimonas sp. CAU 1670]MDF2231760.1 amidohydrolase family protein [Albimonas sp. CAU 1670]